MTLFYETFELWEPLLAGYLLRVLSRSLATILCRYPRRLDTQDKQLQSKTLTRVLEARGELVNLLNHLCLQFNNFNEKLHKTMLTLRPSQCRFLFELRNEEINVKKILAVINATYAVAKRKPEKILNYLST